MAPKKATAAAVDGVVNRIAEVSYTSEVYRPEVVTFTVVGISPLLQNNPAEFIGKTDKDPGLKTKKVYNDAEEASLRCYRDDEGRFGHPAQSFIKAMLRAATGKKFGKVSAPGLIRGNVFSAETLCVIEDEHGDPATRYAIDRQPVVVGDARVLRCRPSWFPWRMRLALEINVALVAVESIRGVLALAGPTVGIGDGRPECDGRFGRYRLE
jgi:hypothetical protein